MITSMFPPLKIDTTFFVFYIQIFQSCHGQKSGVFYDHLVVFNHIKEGNDQIIVLDGNDIIKVFLQIREHIFARCLNSRDVCDRMTFGSVTTSPA